MKHLIEKTDDGSNTLFIPELDEHYHSIKGAFTESRHVFIDMGMARISAPLVRILEVGFGTGLNAYLSLCKSKESNTKVEYTGVELYPLDWETIEKLDYTDDSLFKTIHQAPWNMQTKITDNFTLLKLHSDFTNYKFNPDTLFDVIYFDAFAPEKQPEMWSQALFDYLYSVLSVGGILTTYCAKGIVRRMLIQSGFKVERLPGPPGGKREILRGVR